MDIGNNLPMSEWNASNLLGLNPGSPTGGAGVSLPPVSHTAGDRGAVPWSPDSHAFWLVAIGALTLTGIIGASFNFRAGPAKAGASLGKA